MTKKYWAYCFVVVVTLAGIVLWQFWDCCSTQRHRHCQRLGGAVDIDYFHLAARTAVCGEWFLSLQETVESPLFAAGIRNLEMDP